MALGLSLSRLASAEPSAEATTNSTDGSARITELNETGARAYAERNYRAAIEKFVEAYAIDHDPNLLFNVARCYEKLGDAVAAIEKYQAFLAAPGADTEGRVKAKISLLELEQLRDRGRAATPAATPSASEATPHAADETPRASSSAHGYLPWLSLGAGAVLTSVGATLYVLGMHDHELVTSSSGYGDATQVDPLTRAEAQNYVDAGKTKKLAGGIGLGLGGALLTTGVLLLLTGKSEAAAGGPHGAGLTLSPSERGFSAGYSGRF
ncbi:MAG TPA: hypothetical protein VEQ58_13650 [Polyangiaceae bacterium]|nr:hypothetical protein [Polyangiaceae bacterium]